METVKKYVGSKGFKIALAVLGVLVLMLVSFGGGVAVGIHKAKFSYSWGENYERNFMGSGRVDNDQGRGGMMNGRGGGMMGKAFDQFEGRGFRNAHGLAGTIISITDNNLVVKDRSNKENTVAVTDKTIIKNGTNDLKITDLKQNDQVVIMGNPGDNGVVNADLIRVFSNN